MPIDKRNSGKWSKKKCIENPVFIFVYIACEVEKLSVTNNLGNTGYFLLKFIIITICNRSCKY